MGFIKDAVKGTIGSVFGGGQKSTNPAYANMSQQEQDLTDNIDRKIRSQQSLQDANTFHNGETNQNIQDLFQGHLVDFLSNNGSNGQVSPEQLKAATDYVDQLYTKPANQALQQAGSDASANYAAKAAAYGRDPNTDIASQQAVSGEMARQGLGVAQQRGSMIDQTVNQNYNRGLSTLNTGMQGSGFLNGLAQNAFTNQLNLLNQQSNLANYYQRGRQNMAGPTQTAPGLLGMITSGAGQIGGASNALAGLGGLAGIGGAGSSAAAGAGAGEFLSSSAGIGAAGFALSDVNAKKLIESADEFMEKALDELTAYQYAYKNPAFNTTKKNVSVMAQDLERIPGGDAFIVETEHGKAIDYGKALGFMLATQAHLHGRIKELEAQKGK